MLVSLQLSGTPVLGHQMPSSGLPRHPHTCNTLKHTHTYTLKKRRTGCPTCRVPAKAPLSFRWIRPTWPNVQHPRSARSLLPSHNLPLPGHLTTCPVTAQNTPHALTVLSGMVTMPPLCPPSRAYPDVEFSLAW